MNTLDMFFQNPARPVDAQAAKTSSQTGGDGEDPTGGAFSALMRNIAEKPQGEAQGEPLQIRLSSLDGVALLAGEDRKSGDGSSLGSEPNDQVAGPDGAALNTPEQTKLDAQLTLLIQSGMPLQNRSMPGITTSAASVQPGPARGTLLDLIQLPTDETRDVDILRTLTNAPALKASVVHQETHFKPIPPGSVFGIGTAQSSNAQTQPALMNGTIGAQSKLPEAGGEQADLLASAHEAVVDRRKSNLDLALAGTHSAPEKDHSETMLSMSVMQRIASAIAAESETASATDNTQLNRTGSAAPSASAKASEGVVRILNIQLHPAELGVVTVKMRLAGERLEMELHASSEETADLLRKDSEKLSSLLRTSGYRPDSLTIIANVGDVSSQDGTSGQRSQPGSQSQSQFGSLQQGSAHSGGQSQRRTREFEGEVQRDQRSISDETSAAVRGNGDLYL